MVFLRLHSGRKNMGLCTLCGEAVQAELGSICRGYLTPPLPSTQTGPPSPTQNKCSCFLFLHLLGFSQKRDSNTPLKYTCFLACHVPRPPPLPFQESKTNIVPLIIKYSSPERCTQSIPTTHTQKVFSTPTHSPTLLPKPTPPFLAATSRLSLAAQSMVPKLRCKRAKPILVGLPVARESCTHPAQLGPMEQTVSKGGLLSDSQELGLSG